MAEAIPECPGEASFPVELRGSDINVIIGASPGGDTDFNARTMAKYFEQVTGSTMVITNMPGGGATIAPLPCAPAHYMKEFHEFIARVQTVLPRGA